MPQAPDGFTAMPLLAEHGFPLVYRVDERTRRGINFLLVFLAGLFLLFNIVGWTRGRSRPTSLGELLSLIFVELAMPTLIVWLGSVNNKRVILHGDSIEVAGWFYSRKLYIAAIRGRQTTGSSRPPYGYAHVFLPSDTSKRKLTLPPFLRRIRAFGLGSKQFPKSRGKHKKCCY